MTRARSLLKEGIDVNARCSDLWGLTPLTLASWAGHTAVVKLLLDAGADPNRESHNGRTPLMRVANADICRMLLEAGADARAVDDGGHTVLMYPSDAECCRLLLESGAKADALNSSGNGALRIIAWWVMRRFKPRGSRSKLNARYDRNLAEVFRLLIAAGAKLEPPHEDSSTALTLLDDLKPPEAKRVLTSAPVQATRRRNARS
jgi:ankyrin repeat protein